MSKPGSFMHRVLQGDAVLDEIEDYLEAWHDEEETDLSVAEYLGMTQEEYDLWAEKPASLRLILAAREEHQPLYATIERFAELEPVAARAADPEAARVVWQWLRDTGRIKG
jgi:hypothetical protein